MRWVSKGGDVYQAARITINLDTEEISLEGSVQGTLEDKGKKTTDATGATEPPAAPGTQTDTKAGPATANPAPDSNLPRGSGSGQ